MHAAAGRSRSFGGCATCRRRHVKCDESQPSCSMCKTAGIACEGYAKKIFFDFEHVSDADNGRFRRPLFTENERRRMTERLTDIVPPFRLARSLEEIDEAAENDVQNLVIQRGPFGAFSSTIGSELGDVTTETSLDDLRESINISEGLDTTSFPQDLSVYFGQELPNFQLDLWTGMDQSESDTLLDTDMSISTVDLASEYLVLPPTVSHHPSWAGGVASNDLTMQATVSHWDIDPTVPHDAVFLIKHFSSQVLNMLTPYSHNKTPWHVLFVPHVKNCLAALTLGEQLDSASLCSFFATLALSAFSLGGIHRSDRWKDQGHTYFRVAEQYYGKMVDTAYDVPKTMKYKSILIGLLSMVHVALLTGDPELSESILIDTEQFIRVKGLHRTKSRKVRMLHHCYVYERMLHETTYIHGSKSGLRSRSRKAIESSGAIVYSKDGLSFRVGDWDNLDEQLSTIKSREDGENDLHLERPGKWPATLYPEIFGVPEAYMFALSLIIRLGEWKDEANNGPDLNRFLSRAKIVERYVKNLASNTSSISSIGTCVGRGDQALDKMLIAMHGALSIYFYRRIYDLDATMLQIHVAKVLECLSDHKVSHPDATHGYTRLLWPAFIAASEAEDLESRAAFSAWFTKASRLSGLQYFEQADQSAKRIWHQKSDSSQHTTWIQYMSTAVARTT